MYQRILCIILFVGLLHIQLISCQCHVYKHKPAARQLQVEIDHVTCGQRSINISFVYKGNSSNAVFHIVPQEKDLLLFHLRQKLSNIVSGEKIQIKINVTQENLPTKVAVLSSRYSVLVRCSIIFESCGSTVTTDSPMNFTSIPSNPSIPTKQKRRFHIWRLSYIVIPVVSVLSLIIVIVFLKCAQKRSGRSEDRSGKYVEEEKHCNFQNLKTKGFYQNVAAKNKNLL